MLVQGGNKPGADTNPPKDQEDADILLDDPRFVDPTRRPSELAPIYKNLGY